MNEHWTSLEQKLAGTEPEWQVLLPCLGSPSFSILHIIVRGSWSSFAVRAEDRVWL